MAQPVLYHDIRSSCRKPCFGAVRLDEVVPAFIGEAIFVEAEEWPPARGKWLAARVHAGFLGKFVSLAGVAAEAGGDDVFPSGAAAFIARRDVIEVELCLGQHRGAVLAGKLVAEKHITAAETHFQAWKTIIDGEHHDLRSHDRDARTVDHAGSIKCGGVADP